MELKICHLYPDILNLYGDRGQHPLHASAACAWRGHRRHDRQTSPSDMPLKAAAYDLLFHRRRPGL